MVKFDLSQIDKSATINSAKLELYIEAEPRTGDATANLYNVAKAWNEMESTWFKATNSVFWDAEGGDYEANVEASAPITASSAKKWHSFDVKSLVQKFVKNPETNFGFFGYMSVAMVTVEYSSSEATTAANRPKLTVNYEDTGIKNFFSNSQDQIKIGRTAGKYLMQVPFSGNHTVRIYDVKGAQLASFMTTQSDKWYELPCSIQPGIHLVRISSNERNIVKKIWFVE